MNLAIDFCKLHKLPLEVAEVLTKEIKSHLSKENPKHNNPPLTTRNEQIIGHRVILLVVIE